MKLAAFLLMGAVLLPTLATAGDGHDHGEAAPTAANPNAPQRLPDGSVFLPKKPNASFRCVLNLPSSKPCRAASP